MSSSEEVDKMFEGVFGKGSVKDLGDGVRAIEVDGSDLDGMGGMGDLIKKIVKQTMGGDSIDEIQDIARDQVVKAFESLATAIAIMATSAKLRFEYGAIDNSTKELDTKLEMSTIMLQVRKDVRIAMEQMLNGDRIDDRLDLLIERRYANGQAKPMLSMLVVQDMLNHLLATVDAAVDQIELDRTSRVDPESDNEYAHPFSKTPSDNPDT